MLNKHDIASWKRTIKQWYWRVQFDHQLQAHLVVGAFYTTIAVLTVWYTH